MVLTENECDSEILPPGGLRILSYARTGNKTVAMIKTLLARPLQLSSCLYL
jgi:hypothetical protein